MSDMDRVLFPPMDDKSREGPGIHFYAWEAIEAAAPAPSGSLMPSDHPFARFLPAHWDQGGEYDCVGMATAIMQQLVYLALTGQFPTNEEMASFEKNAIANAHGCGLIYDRLYYSVFSAWWAYIISRIDGNVQSDLGSYCAISIQIAQRTGGVPWDKCLTPKSRSCPGADKSFPLTIEELRTVAKDHRIDGYAAISTWEGLKSSILSNPAHCVIMPINMWSSPPDANGNLTSVGRVIGSHALPWLFVDAEGDRIGCWNSWGDDYPRITWIDSAYWSKNAGKAFAPIDKSEVIIARALYSVLDITANTDCVFTVDGVERPERRTLSAAVERGKARRITARPVAIGLYDPPLWSREITPVDEERIPINIAFTRIGGGGGLPDWAQRLLDWARGIFKRVMIR